VGSIDRRLARFEREAEGILFETFILPDGTEIKCAPGEVFEAVAACIGNREHPLLPTLRSVDTNRGLPGLVRALEGSRARRDSERVEDGD
jgi:hypothetical protein